MADSLVELMKQMTINQYSVGSHHWVHVTHVNDPGDFYARPTSYKDYLPILKQYDGPADPSILHLGATTVYRSKIKKRHLRGTIKNIREEDGKTVYDLFAIDYGFFEPSVPVESIKKPLDSGPWPGTVLHCQLADCAPKKNEGFDADAIEAMVYYLGTERAKMIVRGNTSDGKYIVQLYNTCPEDIATMLALTNYTCIVGCASNAIGRMSTITQPKLYYTYKQLKAGDTLRVRVQSGDSLKSFYVCDVDDHKQYYKEYRSLKDFICREDDFHAENLKPGNALAVFSDWQSRYERAIIREVVIPQKKAIVQLVDWGSMSEIDIDRNRLKVLSRECYFHRPAFAIYCQAEESQVWDNRLHRLLRQGYEFDIAIKEVGRELKTPSIVSILMSPPKSDFDKAFSTK